MFFPICQSINTSFINYPYFYPSIILSTHSSIYNFIHLFIHPFIHPPFCLPIHPSIQSTIHSFIHCSICSSIHPLIYPSIHPFIHPSIHRTPHCSTEWWRSYGTQSTATPSMELPCINSSRTRVVGSGCGGWWCLLWLMVAVVVDSVCCG